MNPPSTTPGLQAATVEPPAAAELLALVARFLKDEIGPQIEDEKLRFRVRIAENLLQIARREIDAAGSFERDADGYSLTPELLRSASSLQALSASLLDGERDLMAPETFALVERYVEAKLRIAAPALLATRNAAAG